MTFTRECPVIEVDTSLPSERVIVVLEQLAATRGLPSVRVCDNGPEFTAHRVRDWLETVEVKTLFIEPGSPWENGHVESFHASLRAEFLIRELFFSTRTALRRSVESRVTWTCP